MLSSLESEMPAIQQGLFDLIAKIFTNLPTATIVIDERMVDFSRWLAAMEAATDVPAGSYQHEYSNALNQGQRDALLDNVLAAAVLEFGEKISSEHWSGTPSELLITLNSMVTRDTHRSRDWPDNAIALSKRLQALQAGLATQDVFVEFGRGKERTITIEKKGRY